MSVTAAMFTGVSGLLNNGEAINVIGNNIANVNTAGYARRQLDLASVPPADNLTAGGGVEVSSIRAIRRDSLNVKSIQEYHSGDKKSDPSSPIAGQRA